MNMKMMIGFTKSTILIPVVVSGLVVAFGNALETTLNVLSPSTLRQSLGYSHKAAEFGFTQCPFSYSDKKCRLQGTIVPTLFSICNDNDVEQADTILQQQLQLQLQQPQASSSLILLVERGDCPFSTTARLVQSLGMGVVEGLIIADHTCLCSTSIDACSITTENPCAPNPPVMIDEDTTSDLDSTTSLYLPTVLMEKQDAQVIEAYFKTTPTTTITVELTWPAVPDTADLVTIDYWHVPGPYRDGQSLAGLGQLLESMPQRVIFTPHFSFVSGHDLGCHPDDAPSMMNTATGNNSVCEDMCTNHGRYCAQDPENIPFQGVSGADMVMESLRRMCIWELYGHNTTDFIGLQFWKYVIAFDETCIKDSFTPLEASYNEMWMNQKEPSCSITAMTKAGLSYEEVSRCMVESNDVWDDKENWMLEEALQEEESMGGSNPPTLIVNNVQFRGRTFLESFGAICSSFNVASVPDACATCMACADQYGCLVNGNVCRDTGMPIGPTATPGDVAANNQDTAPGDQEVEAPTAPPTNEKETPTQSSETDEVDEGSDGISDGTKVVIVVAVVGGAIVVIFAVVMVLVCKLLRRIRLLEKNDKETPTSTSPAGSNNWELPYYVVPYNSNNPVGDCDTAPNIAQNNVPGRATQTADSTVSKASIGLVSANDVVRSDFIQDEPSGKSGQTKPMGVEGTGALVSLSKESIVQRPAIDNDNEATTASIFREKDHVAKDGKRKGSPGRTKAKQRKPKIDPVLIEIMGRAAPEAKFPKSFSYENEEKEEIVEEVVDE